MNFLFIRAKKSIFDFPWAFMELGYTVTHLEGYEFDPLDPDPAPYNALRAYLDVHPTSCVISYLFLPVASDLCQERNIRYISWTYDSPLVSLFSPSEIGRAHV